MINRITPDHITGVRQNEVFVFGSNLAGRHGKGAAKLALKWGAKYGQAFGLQGQTYAIPTKDANIRESLPISQIKGYVDGFIGFAKQNPNMIFLVTPIGTGLAGIKPEEIAPLFKEAIQIDNIHLPKIFWQILIGY